MVRWDKRPRPNTVQWSLAIVDFKIVDSPSVVDNFLATNFLSLFLCSNSPVVVDFLSSGHFLGKRLSDFCIKCGFFCWFLSHLAFHLFNACSKCDKAFSQKTHLKKQGVIHTGQKPHACSKCDKTFTQKAYLKTQELIHTGKKPHVC